MRHGDPVSISARSPTLVREEQDVKKRTYALNKVREGEGDGRQQLTGSVVQGRYGRSKSPVIISDLYDVPGFITNATITPMATTQTC